MELSTETLTEEGGTDGAVCVRESQDRIRLCELHSLVAIVLAVIVSSSLPPPVRVAVTVMEYSVPPPDQAVCMLSHYQQWYSSQCQ